MRRLALLIGVMVFILCVCSVMAQDVFERDSKTANDAYNRAVDFNRKADNTWGVSGKTEWYTMRAISEILIATYLQKQELISQNQEIIKLLKERQK